MKKPNKNTVMIPLKKTRKCGSIEYFVITNDTSDSRTETKGAGDTNKQ